MKYFIINKKFFIIKDNYGIDETKTWHLTAFIAPHVGFAGLISENVCRVDMPSGFEFFYVLGNWIHVSLHLFSLWVYGPVFFFFAISKLNLKFVGVIGYLLLTLQYQLIRSCYILQEILFKILFNTLFY